MNYEYKSFLEEFFYTAIVGCESTNVYLDRSVYKKDTALDELIEKYIKGEDEQNEFYNLFIRYASDWREIGFENGFKLGMNMAAAAFLKGSGQKSFLEEFFYTAIVECDSSDVYSDRDVYKNNQALDELLKKYVKGEDAQNEFFDAFVGYAIEWREIGFENGFKLGMNLAAAAFLKENDREH